MIDLEKFKADHQATVIPPVQLDYNATLMADNPVLVEVLREHVTFLREQLKDRDCYWKERALELEKVLVALRLRDTQCKVVIAEMCQYIKGLEYAHSEEIGYELSSEDDFNRWWGLTK